MTTKQDLFDLFVKTTGKTTYVPHERKPVETYQESRVKEFAFTEG